MLSTAFRPAHGPGTGLRGGAGNRTNVRLDYVPLRRKSDCGESKHPLSDGDRHSVSTGTADPFPARWRLPPLPSTAFP